MCFFPHIVSIHAFLLQTEIMCLSCLWSNVTLGQENVYLWVLLEAYSRKKIELDNTFMTVWFMCFGPAHTHTHVRIYVQIYGYVHYHIPKKLTTVSMECNFAMVVPINSWPRDPNSLQRLTSKFVIRTEDASHATEAAWWHRTTRSPAIKRIGLLE